MKYIGILFILAVLYIFSGCQAQHSFNSSAGKKKLKYYNSIQYGNTQYPNAKKNKF